MIPAIAEDTLFTRMLCGGEGFDFVRQRIISGESGSFHPGQLLCASTFVTIIENVCSRVSPS
jgi:hypothetical protein